MQQESLVLLGGYMCDARIFDPQISEFSQDRMVILPPAMTGRSMPDYIRGLLDHLPPRFAVAGYDLGGFGAMELLHKVPDRVTRIALIATNALADTPPRKRSTRGGYYQGARGLWTFGDRRTFADVNRQWATSGWGIANCAGHGFGIGARCHGRTIARNPKTFRSSKHIAQMSCPRGSDLR